jgi:DNA polymerase-3 subunit epsilon
VTTDIENVLLKKRNAFVWKPTATSDIENVLFVDTETGGLDPKKDPVVELGFVLWNVEAAAAVTCWSSLIFGATNDAEDANHIPKGALRHGIPPEVGFSVLQKYAQRADVVVAHHAEFDKAFLPDLGKPWVCSMEDMVWPGAKPGGFTSVVALALANGIGVSSAHRALTDCLLLSRLFERAVERGWDIRAMVRHGLRPKAEFVSLAPYDDREMVKANGFKWFPEDKEWRRRMAVEDAGKLPFRVTTVKKDETDYPEPS